MKNIKKLISIAMAGLIGVSLFVGCGKNSSTGSNNETSADKKTNPKKIGVAVENFSDQFQMYLMEAMKDQASKDKSIELVFMDAKSDAQKQLSQIENLIAQKVDAIMFLPMDPESSLKVANEVEKSGIPLIAVNRRLDHPYVSAYVGSDDTEGGKIQAEEMVRLLGGKGNVGIIAGGFGHDVTIRRVNGNKSVIEKNPDIKLVAEDTGEWFRDKGMDLAENWLSSNKDLNAILCNNDEMAIGAAKAIEDAGLTGKILVAGIDATPEALEYVKAGKVTFTVFQDAFGQGRKAVEVVTKIVNGEKVDKEQLIPFELVTKDKADEYANKYK